ncbi:hypothetical protein [Xanthomonas sp. NCPPB 1062]|uniref:hypothetical protein n=1 Tax=Xanthomonas sp. NCPPB 1062 TaxID=487523 RepID=UPI00355620E1
MLIKFEEPDPRAGLTARLDSSLAQKFVDEGRASKVAEGAEVALDTAPPSEDAGSAPAPGKTVKKKRA